MLRFSVIPAHRATRVIPVHEEGVEDRYNLMDIKDSIYTPAPSSDHDSITSAGKRYQNFISFITTIA